jgi:hypothetical protein
MLPDNICLPVSDDQYPDDKANYYSNQSTLLILGITQVRQPEL